MINCVPKCDEKGLSKSEKYHRNTQEFNWKKILKNCACSFLLYAYAYMHAYTYTHTYRLWNLLMLIKGKGIFFLRSIKSDLIAGHCFMKQSSKLIQCMQLWFVGYFFFLIYWQIGCKLNMTCGKLLGPIIQKKMTSLLFFGRVKKLMQLANGTERIQKIDSTSC